MESPEITPGNGRSRTITWRPFPIHAARFGRFRPEASPGRL
jgi:hypothetical protein